MQAGGRVLVTGAAGFVGRHLVPRLRRAGHDVVAVDREVDVTDPPALAAAVARCAPRAVVHLAAQSSVAASRAEPCRCYRVNFGGTQALLEAVSVEAPGARVLVVGSGDEYGSAAPGDAPFTESAPLRPDSPYARSKVAADLLAGDYARRGLDVVRVRPFNHTGPGQSESFVLASFARQVAAIEAGRAPPRLAVGNLDSVRDFLDVEDVVDAYLRLLDPAVPPDVYNVASGTGVRIGDALDALLARAGADAAIEVDPERLRPVDWRVGDASRLRAATGWEPRTPLAVTLGRLLEGWRAELRGA